MCFSTVDRLLEKSLSSAVCFCMRVHTFHTNINIHQYRGDVAGQCYGLAGYFLRDIQLMW